MPRTTSALPFILMLAAFTGGCTAPQPTEINYRRVVPKVFTIAPGTDVAIAFASRLTAAARLEVLSQTRLKGKASNDVTYIVSLRSSAASGVFVNILFNEPYRTVAMTISGDVANPEATRIAQESAKVFSLMVPGSVLAPFSGNQALFGP